jgi:hypothetical protein
VPRWIPLVVLGAALLPAGLARADVPPPVEPPPVTDPTATAPVPTDPAAPPVTAPPVTAPTVTAPAPATTAPGPAPTIPYGPETPPAMPVRQDPDRLWAVPAATRLAVKGLWTRPIGDLDAPATRRELARIAIGISGGPSAEAAARMPADVDPTAPDALALAEAVRRGWLAAPGGQVGPDQPVTAGEADQVLVRAMGLDAERRGLANLATADGRRFALPDAFASEVLAREAGLRHNYPSVQDRLERAPDETVARADLAGMGAAALAVRTQPRRRALLRPFATVRLPAMSARGFARIQSALLQVGQPYVWGGEWPTTASPEGPQSHGGFDCSGLAWFAVQSAARQSELGPVGGLLSRTTADRMAYAVPGRRIGLRATRPGDMLFFGSLGRRSRPGTISHMALIAGNGWIVQSSGTRDGVSLTRRATYWPSGEALAKRL